MRPNITDASGQSSPVSRDSREVRGSLAVACALARYGWQPAQLARNEGHPSARGVERQAAVAHKPRPLPRPHGDGGLAGVCPKGLYGLYSGPAHSPCGTRQRPSSAPLRQPPSTGLPSPYAPVSEDRDSSSRTAGLPCPPACHYQPQRPHENPLKPFQGRPATPQGARQLFLPSDRHSSEKGYL